MTSLSETFGALFIGVLLGAVLSGLTAVQAFTFLRANKHDPLGHKIAVLFLWFLDAFQLCILAHAVYYYLITDPIGPTTRTIWTFPTHVAVQKVIMPLTQSFYVLRIWKLTHRSRMALPLLLSIMVSLNFSIGVYISVRLYGPPTLLEIMQLHIQWALYFMLSLTSATDILIAATLIYTLSHSGTNLRWTNSSGTMLFAYLLNTGVFVSFCSAAGVIAYAASPKSFIFLSIEAVLTKLYVNGFMGMLNARYYLQTTKNAATVVFQARETTYSLSDMTNNRANMRASLTINEVGLPLFKQELSKPEVDRIKMMEVVVQKEEHSTKD